MRNSNAGYGAEGMNTGASEFNPNSSSADHPEYGMYDDNSQQYDDNYITDGAINGYYETHDSDANMPEGTFYPFMPPYMPHIQSAPVSAIAIDPVADATYVAGHTTLIHRKRHHAGYQSPAEQRASMLATHIFSAGTLYSACAAHPEAKVEVLDNISTSIYGNSYKTPPANKIHMKIPNHAYLPPYDPVSKSEIGIMAKRHHLGVTNILPFTSKVASTTIMDESGKEKSEGYHCSISPSAVRVHTRGGLQVSSSKIMGMVSGTFHPGIYSEPGVDDKMISSCATHVTVGGVSTNRAGTNLYCLDLYSSSLKVAASHAVRTDSGHSKMCISDLATNHETTNIIAGCSDGTLRIFDGSWRGGNYMECAKVKAHGGGVAHIATSGNLICTTGFSSRCPVNYSAASSQLYAFPDEHVLVFDIRYLGRGGIAHPFSGLKGGPRFVSFIPGLDDTDVDRVLACSGQAGGGVQIITPFDSLSGNPSASNDYFNLPMDSSEAITAVSCVGKNLAIGTSHGNVMTYSMSGYDQIMAKKGKLENLSNDEPLDTPTFLEPPPLSIEPHLLQGSVSHDAPSISVFNPYVMCKEPMVTPTALNGEWNPYSFGLLSENVCSPAGKQVLSKNLKHILANTSDDGYSASIQTSNLGINLLKSMKNSATSGKQELSNPNKLLHGKHLKNVCYDVDVDPRKKNKKDDERDSIGKIVPWRYRTKDRPANSMFTIFDFAALNDTAFPGYDYPPTMSNSYICPVLLLLYFIPEIQNSMLESQQLLVHDEMKAKKSTKNTPILSGELGFLYHQINSISAHAMCHPKPPGTSEDPCRPVVGTFVPSNFLSNFVTMQEAVSLALLDDSPAAADIARRPEAFYRFLLHHLDRELQNSKRGSKTKEGKMIDSLQGLDSVSMNEFVTGSGPPSANLNRTYTVELSYEAYLKNSADEESPDFMHLLQYSLSKYVKLRAWCETTKNFETVVQRKIITTLPKILSLSCACAGVHGQDKLPFWRKVSDDHSHWLPELIEVEINENGNITTRQMVHKQDSSELEWQEYRGKALPDSVVTTLKETSGNSGGIGVRSARYRIDLVLTYLNEHTNDGGESPGGRHIVHTRVPVSYQKRALYSQLEKLKQCAADTDRISKLTLLHAVAPEDIEKRIHFVEEKINELAVKSEGEDEWVLFNGPNVSSTTIDDALAFHVPFKEPCIIIFRQVDMNVDIITEPRVEISDTFWNESPLSPVVPHEGDSLAFDAEFVQVENETSTLTATGSKVVIREGRNAVGRISLLDCESEKELVDDHVIPTEPVMDFLTRFSGITSSDLNPKISSHHLISARSAYMKMRYLVDRGCKFVGHGLRNDFHTVNLFVPPCQIIDTLHIFHLKGRRYISLRFLVNYLLQRDMQVEIHDSIEDSRAANELYLKALEFKENGSFDEILRKIYERGNQTDWKVAELTR